MANQISTFPALPLTYQCTVVYEARDPSTGDLVDGVQITNPVLYGVNLTPDVDTSSNAAQQTPLFTPIPNEELRS